MLQFFYRGIPLLSARRADRLYLCILSGYP
ncbi:Uncharacterised protein [Vibrio cholerae]|nr:Uncharacterised protein [Vibrio cholerae]